MTNDERALAFAMGSLSEPERAELARARLYDPGLDAAIAAWEQRLAPLTGLAGERMPSDALFDRITATIAEDAVELAGKTVLPFAEGDWRPFLPGIQIKQLWTSGTFLLRCGPGAIIPPHPHPRTEHLLVIGGDFTVGGRTFGTGDYHSSPAGNDHGPGSTESGCILLVQLAA